MLLLLRLTMPALSALHFGKRREDAPTDRFLQHLHHRDENWKGETWTMPVLCRAPYCERTHSYSPVVCLEMAWENVLLTGTKHGTRKVFTYRLSLAHLPHTAQHKCPNEAPPETGT